MSQNDLNIANQSGASFRADLNNALPAISSLSAGATEPPVMFAYMWWADTTSGNLKQRNAANTAWVVKFKLDQAYNNVENTADVDKVVSSATQTLIDGKEATDTKIVRVASGTLSLWTGTQTAYDALTPNANTLYFIEA
ncbi:MAG: hypothetical protein COB23_09640 [Methylophaga sp.]|nr:MAG: hypothetical protein COB23_09640 [Methylophaga sp.]